VKEQLKSDPNKTEDWNISDERTFYTPKFFTKEVKEGGDGKKSYIYTPKTMEVEDAGKQPNYLYWQLRETKQWSMLPNLFSPDCPPFY